jgi:hypothetical protein
MEKKNYIECFICMEAAKTPVTGGCGHIFCWRCINQWLRDKEMHSCPICKNGIEISKMIRIYDGNDGDTQDAPRNERQSPVENRHNPSFVKYKFYLGE